MKTIVKKDIEIEISNGYYQYGNAYYCVTNDDIIALYYNGNHASVATSATDLVAEEVLKAKPISPELFRENYKKVMIFITTRLKNGYYKHGDTYYYVTDKDIFVLYFNSGQYIGIVTSAPEVAKSILSAETISKEEFEKAYSEAIKYLTSKMKNFDEII